MFERELPMVFKNFDEVSFCGKENRYDSFESRFWSRSRFRRKIWPICYKFGMLKRRECLPRMLKLIHRSRLRRTYKLRQNQDLPLHIDGSKRRRYTRATQTSNLYPSLLLWKEKSTISKESEFVVDLQLHSAGRFKPVSIEQNNMQPYTRDYRRFRQRSESFRGDLKSCLPRKLPDSINQTHWRVCSLWGHF